MLGGILIDPGAFARVDGLVDAAMFFRAAHGLIYQAQTALARRMEAIDPITVRHELHRTGRLEQAVGAPDESGEDYLASILDAVPTAANIEHHARIVRETAQRRAVIDAAKEASRQAYDPEGPPPSEIAAGIADAMAVALTDEVRLSRACDIDTTLPDWIIRMDPARGGGAVLSVGEVAIHTGRAKEGKSALAFQLAHACAAGGRSTIDESGRDVEYGQAAGLDVRAGCAVILTLEDSARHVAHRLGLIGSGSWVPAQPPRDVFVHAPGHLMTIGRHVGDLQRAPQWDALWRAVHARSPMLVVIDPAASALLGPQNDAAAVRGFMQALRAQAERGECGILLVAHSAKAASFDAEADDPSQIAGSHQWEAAARGVLVHSGAGPKAAVVECPRANHGQSGWAIEIAKIIAQPPDPAWGTRFCGWSRVQRHSPEEWAAERKARKNTAQDAAAAARHETTDAAVLKALPAEWASQRQCCDLAGMGRGRWAPAALRLLKEGAAERRTHPDRANAVQWRRAP